MSPRHGAFDALCAVVEEWGKAMRMRAVECAVPNCGHIHGPNDEALVELVLRHSHHAHREMHLREQAAVALVDESAYDDKKHAKLKGWVDAAADGAGRYPGGA